VFVDCYAARQKCAPYSRTAIARATSQTVCDRHRSCDTSYSRIESQIFWSHNVYLASDNCGFDVSKVFSRDKLIIKSRLTQANCKGSIGRERERGKELGREGESHILQFCTANMTALSLLFSNWLKWTCVFEILLASYWRHWRTFWCEHRSRHIILLKL